MIRRCFVAFLGLALLGLAPAADAAVLVYLGTFEDETGTGSPGTGSAQVTIDSVANTMRVQAVFSGLLGVTTISHIHAPTAAAFTGNAGVATSVPSFPEFPVGVQAGSYDRTFDLGDAGTWNPAFVTNNGGTIPAATANFIDYLNQGRAYFNIHTNLFPPGEIRAVMVAVPEPSSVAMLALGLVAAGGMGLARCRRRA